MTLARVGARKKGSFQLSRGVIADAAKIDQYSTSWSTQVIHIDDLIFRNLRPIRARCRDAYINNSLIKRFVGLLQRNVIGHAGIQLQMQVTDDDGSADDLANEAIEKAFTGWSKRKNCEVTGRYSWLSIQLAWIFSVAIDGEFLARKIRGGGPYGFQWQLLDPELLDVNYNERLDNGCFIRFGIEFTDYGKPVAYYLLNRDAFSATDHVFNGNKYTRIVAEDIFHDFISLFVGQKRGLPMPHAALYDLHQLKGYDEAALIAARLGASQSGFFTRDMDSDDDIPALQGDQSQGTARDPINVSVEPGEIDELPKGVGFVPFNPDYPHSQYGEFTKSHQRRASSGLDVSYNPLANDLSDVNYSSIRQGTLDDREAWKLLQSHGIQGLCDETYEEFLPLALLNGKITVNGNALPFAKIEKFQASMWQGRRWDWVDPVKDAKAAEIAEDRQWTSKSRNIRERGNDPEEIAKEIERDKKRFPPETENTANAEA